MDNLYWYRVLKHFEENNYFNNGLTIPFVIGSRMLIKPDEPLQTVRELITEIKDSSHFVTLMRCGFLNEYVISLLDYETNSLRKSHVNLFREFDHLIIVDGSFANVFDFEELINELEDDYQGTIDDGFYSKEFGRWEEFRSHDKSRIIELLN